MWYRETSTWKFSKILKTAVFNLHLAVCLLTELTASEFTHDNCRVCIRYVRFES